MPHGLAHVVRRAFLEKRGAAVGPAQRGVDMAALARILVRPFRHECRHQPAPLGHRFGEGLEQNRLVRGTQRVVHGDGRLDDAWASLRVQTLDRHVHLLAGVEEFVIELRQH